MRLEELLCFGPNFQTASKDDILELIVRRRHLLQSLLEWKKMCYVALFVRHPRSLLLRRVVGNLAQEPEDDVFAARSRSHSTSASTAMEEGSERNVERFRGEPVVRRAGCTRLQDVMHSWQEFRSISRLYEESRVRNKSKRSGSMPWRYLFVGFA